MTPSFYPRYATGGAAALLAAALVFFASDRLRGLLENTALLASGAGAIALSIGVVFGVFIAKTDLPGRRWLVWLLAAMAFVPLYVQAAAWNAMLGAGGWVPQIVAHEGYGPSWFNGWTAAVWIHAMGAVPWAALLTAASLSAVERRLEEESLLDASPLRVIARVSLRRGWGGVLTAAVWIALVCATEIAVTDLFQLRTFAEEIYTEASLGWLSGASSTLLASDMALGVALIALMAGLALRLMVPWLPDAAAIDAEARWKWQVKTGRGILAAAMWSLAAAVMFLPLAGLVWKAGVEVVQHGDKYERTWSCAKAALMVAQSPWEHRREWAWSLAIGALAAASAVFIGVLLAWLARVQPRSSKLQLVGIAVAIAIPAPLWGVWVIGLMNHSPDSIFAPLTTLYDRTLAAPVLVQWIRALPLVSLWLWSQLASVPRDLLEAARSEGAGPIAQLVGVALPLRRAGVAAAALIGFVLAVGEVSATLLVTPPGVTTISVRIFQLIHYGVDDRVAAISLSIFGILGAFALVAAWLTRPERQRPAPCPGRPSSVESG
jgi:iron(III) transport system permease protein